MKHSSILGISGIDRSFAVSLYSGGRISFAIEEDKLRRFRGLGMRHLEGLGSRAIDLGLSRLGREIHGVEVVAYVPPVESSAEEIQEQCEFVSQFLERHYGISPPVEIVDYCSAHLAFERAVHGNAEHVFHVSNSRAIYSRSGSAAHELDRKFSIGQFAEDCAEFLGLDPHRIHHLEGIARRGEPRFLAELQEVVNLGTNSNSGAKAFRKLTGSPQLSTGKTLLKVHFDIAASFHELLRREICDLLNSISFDRAGTVALSGEVFQSWSLNDQIASQFPDTNFLFSFASGSSACAVGGPLVLAGHKQIGSLSPFLGPRYSPAEVKSVLDNCKARYEYCPSNQATEMVCEALMQGKMVGWFNGPCEFGYRALGARSVFANPANPYACDNLSSFLKKRPSYLPYAVAMKEDEIPGIRSPHLSRSTHLPEYFDNSPVRLQTVSSIGSPSLYQLLESFQARSGVRAMLNTSLNYFEEPIACTPRDALKTFFASGLDVLVIENFVLRKS